MKHLIQVIFFFFFFFFFFVFCLFVGVDGFQKMFVYQSTFNMVELKKDKGTDYIISWKSEGLFESKLFPLHGTFLPNTKYFGYKIGMRFNNNSFVCTVMQPKL